MYKKEIKFSQNNGFTLVELMIVIAIIDTLAGIATPNYISYRQKVLQLKIITDIICCTCIRVEIIFLAATFITGMWVVSPEMRNMLPIIASVMKLNFVFLLFPFLYKPVGIYF